MNKAYPLTPNTLSHPLNHRLDVWHIVTITSINIRPSKKDKLTNNSGCLSKNKDQQSYISFMFDSNLV